MTGRLESSDKKMLDRKKIVWMIIPNFYPAVGGAESQARVLAKTLHQQTIDVRILTRVPSGFSREAFLEPSLEGIPVLRTATFGNTAVDSIYYLLAGFWQLLIKGRGAIYHAHAVGSAGWLAVAAGRLLGGRSIVKLRTNCDVYEQTYASGLGKWQFWLLMHVADRLLVVNYQVKDWLIRRGIAAEKIFYLPNSVDTHQFSPVDPRRKAEIRKQSKIPAGKRIVLYVGRLSFVKGVDLLIAAWAKLPADCRQLAELWIVGDGPERQKLERQASEAGIRASVVFTGLQDHVVGYYQAADLFILPSRAEGLSNALVEAMACELPCLASAVGGALDLIVDGQNGRLFEREDVHSLTARLTELLDDTRSSASIGQKARQTVQANAEIEASAKVLQEVYRSL